ncbi:MAG TPA: PfkB family carbohydrate kinase [Solirubrobacteraceae bacterium]|nr:PfkB family carbohydrate kinase [Solirubrobacteraceae bacterium]
MLRPPVPAPASSSRACGLSLRRVSAPEVMVAGHVSLDVFPELYGPVRLAPGQLVVVGPAVMSTGGAVANVGVALHRLGTPVELCAKVGDDLFGTAVRDLLGARAPRLPDGIAVSPGEATSYTIVINPPGEDRSFLHCPGANETFSARDVGYDRLNGVRLFHFGYPPLMPVMFADRGAQLRTMFARVQRSGVATSLDLCEPDPESAAGNVDWPDLLTEVLPFVDVFAPSIDELLFMFDRPAHDRLRAGAPLATVLDRDRLGGLGETLTAMGAAVVAIKLADQGLYLRTARRVEDLGARLGLDAGAWAAREVFSPCFAPRVLRGTTGSGDATIAGLLASLLRGAGPAEAATAATAVGACSVEGVDPTSAIPEWRQVAARIGHGWPRLPSAVAPPATAAASSDATGTILLRT